MEIDNTNKTRRFVKKGIVLWFILIAVFLVVQYLTEPSEGISIEHWWIRYFKDLNMVLLFYWIGGIPIILMLSIILLYIERLLDKLATSRNHHNEDID